MITKDERLLTTGEAAERLGVTRDRVRQFIADGRLPGRKFGRDWAIPAAAVAEFAAIDRPAGNPNFRRRPN